LQESVLQSTLSLQLRGDPEQVPLLHTSLTVQNSPSLQLVPFGICWSAGH